MSIQVSGNAIDTWTKREIEREEQAHDKRLLKMESVCVRERQKDTQQAERLPNRQKDAYFWLLQMVRNSRL